MKKIIRLFSQAMFVLAILPGAIHAHEIRPAIATVTFTGETRFTIDIGVNMEAFMADVSPVHSDTDESPNAQNYKKLRELEPETMRARFSNDKQNLLAEISLYFDGRRVSPETAALEVPPVGDINLARISTLQLNGAIPPGAREFRLSCSERIGDCILRFPDAAGNVEALLLTGGEMSAPYVLGVGLQRPTRAEIAWQYAALGFTHILPKGLDHILFVVGLFLLATRFKPLLWQVTSFTVAHSITLGLTMYGVFSLSPAIVEPLIAASIVYVAVENMFTSRLQIWRIFIVFGFGLLHGMGFAGVLQEIGLPRSEFLTGLIAFNLGVEAGQLAVILLAYLAVGWWFKDRSWYRSRVVLPASGLIAAIGLFWTIERLIGLAAAVVSSTGATQ